MDDSFVCPITLEVMRDPVVAADGHSYERRAIEAWFAEGKSRSPVTNLHLPHSHLNENRALRKVIAAAATSTAPLANDAQVGGVEVDPIATAFASASAFSPDGGGGDNAAAEQRRAAPSSAASTAARASSLRNESRVSTRKRATPTGRCAAGRAAPRGRPTLPTMLRHVLRR